MSNITLIHLSLSWLLIIAVVLPFVRNDYWIFRILEYPRYQKLVFCCLVLAGFIFLHDFKNNFTLITFLLLCICVLYLTYKVLPYTMLSSIEMKQIKAGDINNEIKIFGANVYQENTAYNKMLAQIKQNDPDVIMLLETDKKWEKEMDVLLKDYPHAIKEPLDNTYGMLFYSRLKTNGFIQYLVDKEVPSLEAIIELPGGQPVKIWGLHPKPPVPGEEDRSTAKDKEIMKAAFKVKKETLPVIVMGDLNDVAWSYVTKLFRKTSGLLDPRRGRGFYSTFSANNWFLRFPLDYVFCSADFGLIKMKKLNHNGSDHFPMFSHFKFDQALKNVQQKPVADSDEMEEAAEKAKQPT